MDHLFKKTQAEFQHRQGDFLATELATCSRCALLAWGMYKSGKRNFADRQFADAEDAYETAHRLVTDPKYSKQLTIKAVQEFTKKLEVLREKLDDLQRFRGPNENRSVR